MAEDRWAHAGLSVFPFMFATHSFCATVCRWVCYYLGGDHETREIRGTISYLKGFWKEMSCTLLVRWSCRQNGDCLKCNCIKSCSVCETLQQRGWLWVQWDEWRSTHKHPGLKQTHSTCSCFLFLICIDIVKQKTEWLSAWAPSVSGNNTFDLKPVHVKNELGYVPVMCFEHCQRFTHPSCPVCVNRLKTLSPDSTQHQWSGRDSLEGTANYKILLK